MNYEIVGECSPTKQFNVATFVEMDWSSEGMRHNQGRGPSWWLMQERRNSIADAREFLH